MSDYQSGISYVPGCNDTIPKCCPREADGAPLGWGVPGVPQAGVHAGTLGLTKKGKLS